MTRLALAAALLLAATPLAPAADPETRVYELSVYSVPPDSTDAFAAAVGDTLAKAHAEGSAKPQGYFRSLDPKAGKFVSLLAFPDEVTYTKFREYFRGAAAGVDVEMDKVKGVTLDLKAKLTPTDFSPAVGLTKADPARVFELRTYTTTPGNLPALDARFRDHTRALFKTHGMTNLWYFHKAAGEVGADDTLVYFLAHASAAARDTSFDDFRKDPKWTAALKASEAKAGGSLTAKDGVKSLLLTPTDYSPIR